jgi:hypothetical protein
MGATEARGLVTVKDGESGADVGRLQPAACNSWSVHWACRNLCCGNRSVQQRGLRHPCQQTRWRLVCVPGCRAVLVHGHGLGVAGCGSARVPMRGLGPWPAPDSVGDPHADGTELALPDPHPGPTSDAAPRADAVCPGSSDHRILQRFHVVAGAETPRPEIHDWVRHDLARPVVRGLAAPRHHGDVDAFLFELLHVEFGPALASWRRRQWASMLCTIVQRLRKGLPSHLS